MNIEKFIEQVLKNPNNINIQYSNINGKEKLILNGKEIKFDDTEIKNKIAEYKAKVAKIDDCLFSEIIDRIEDSELSKMNSALELDSYNEEETKTAEEVMCIMSDVIKDTIYKKIEKLGNLLDEF